MRGSRIRRLPGPVAVAISLWLPLWLPLSAPVTGVGATTTTTSATTTAVEGPVAGEDDGGPAVALTALGTTVGRLLDGIEPRRSSIDAACLRDAPPWWLAGQIVVAGVVQSELPAAAAQAERGRLGGVFVLGRPDAGVADLLAELDAAGRIGSSVDVLSTVDEEGGRVQRLAGLLGPVPSARQLAAEGAGVAGDIVAAHAARVAELGFDSMLGPVVDVGTGPAIGDRSFADDPEAVSVLGAAVIEAMTGAGLVPVLKHFPGHGRADADSHLSLARTPPIESIMEIDLVPYRALSATPGVAVMVGHLDVPGLTDGVPASISSAAVQGLLRTTLGFDGLVMTDALGMRAVADREPPPQAAVLALVAGVDVVLIDDLTTVDPVIDALVVAVAEGTLAEDRLAEAAGRMLSIRGRSGCWVVAARAGGW